MQVRSGRDNNLNTMTYTGTSGGALTPPTHGVTLTLDPVMTKMVDGTGTTSCSYHPASPGGQLGATKLAAVDGQLANDTIEYELCRLVSRHINGSTAGVDFDGKKERGISCIREMHGPLRRTLP